MDDTTSKDEPDEVEKEVPQRQKEEPVDEEELKGETDVEETTGSPQSGIDYGSLLEYERTHMIYGEDFEGEAEYYVPQQQEVELEVEAVVKEFVEGIEQILMEKKVSEMSVEAGAAEEEEEVQLSPSTVSQKSEELERLSSANFFDTLFLKPKEKTVSEIKFEREHREFIEEEMKKFILKRPSAERLISKRKPLEKIKVALADFDTTGLYPQPKAIESEISFAFEEDEEVERSTRILETDFEITKFIMDSLKEEGKNDLTSIFARNQMHDIARVQQIIGEAISNTKKGLVPNLHKFIDDNLPELSPNLRILATHLLRQKLSKYEKIVEEEEEEEQGEAARKRERGEPVKIKTGEKGKPKMKIKEEIKPPKAVKEVPKEEEHISEEKATMPVKEEKGEEVFRITAGEAEEEILYPEVYEKIDWELFLTESEKKIAEDPKLRLEMEKYIEKRKKELLKERQAREERKARERRYRSTDPEIMLENANLNVTMKFILNSGEIYTCAYRYFMTFKEIKEDLSGIFRVPPDILIIYRGEVEIKDEQSAYDLEPKVEPFESVTFRLLTFDNDRWRLKSSHLELPVPDIITCTVETGKDHRGEPEYKEVVVEIEQRQIKKPFVGGYRDVCTGSEYHHAFSQSAPREPILPYDRRVSTDTQTYESRTKATDTVNNKYTQMSRSDYYVSTEYDKIMTAQPYVDYETWLKRKRVEEKVLLIQRYVRAMIIRKFIQKKRKEYRARKLWEEEEERKRLVKREIRVRQDILSMVYPKTKADFEALYAMVERWRKAQIERISKLKTEAPRKAELCGVLEKEIKLLEAIEVHRIAVNKENKKKKELDFLAKVSAPVTWTGYRGMTIRMDTLKTQRARELRELYMALTRDDLNYQDRIELLISLKYALRINCTRMTDEITNLINRECELLIRGVSSDKLEFLRRRIDHLFLKYFKEPDFNPEMAKYDPEYNPELIKQNVIFCKMCHQMKMMNEFTANSRDTNTNVCQPCRTTFNIAVPRIDLNPYRFILKCVRKEEQKKNCYSSCAFIFQDEDMRFLVENIWHSRSAVSENSNLMDLRMPRWNGNKDWTPWNCILLTEMEAKAHSKTDTAINYEKQLVGEIVSKHELAKRHFQQMFKTEKRMQDSGKWANVVDAKEYIPPQLTADIWDLTQSECMKLKQDGRLYDVHETRRKQDNYVKYI